MRRMSWPSKRKSLKSHGFHRQDVIWVDRNAHHSLVFYTRCGISWKWPCRKVLVFHTRASRRSGCLKAKNHQNFLRMSSNEPECATNWVPNAQIVQNHAFYVNKTRKRAVGNSETRMRKSIIFCIWPRQNCKFSDRVFLTFFWSWFDRICENLDFMVRKLHIFGSRVGPFAAHFWSDFQKPECAKS